MDSFSGLIDLVVGFPVENAGPFLPVVVAHFTHFFAVAVNVTAANCAVVIGVFDNAAIAQFKVSMRESRLASKPAINGLLNDLNVSECENVIPRFSTILTVDALSGVGVIIIALAFKVAAATERTRARILEILAFFSGVIGMVVLVQLNR